MRTQVRHLDEVRSAWVAVAFIPVAFVVAVVTGEGLLALQGHESADEDIPAVVALLSGVPAMLVFAVPCVVAWVLGRRAVAAGEARGSTPALIGAVAGVAFIGLNLVGLIGRIAGF
jgi:hypothetical protein